MNQIPLYAAAQGGYGAVRIAIILSRPPCRQIGRADSAHRINVFLLSADMFERLKDSRMTQGACYIRHTLKGAQRLQNIVVRIQHDGLFNKQMLRFILQLAQHPAVLRGWIGDKDNVKIIRYFLGVEVGLPNQRRNFCPQRSVSAS